MAKQKKNTIAVLDLGSTKVVCFIATVNPDNTIEIKGIGHHASLGIKAGNLTDIKAVEKCVLQAVEAAEQMAEESINRVYVNISSNNLLSQRLTSNLVVTGHEINDNDISKLLFQQLDRFNQQDMEVIHSFAYDYMLDGARGVESPLGMYGNNLACDFHIVSCPMNTLMNINNCIGRCQLDIENYIASAYSSGLSCLTEDEIELGVTLIEYGGGSTSVSIFNKGHMLYLDALPLGGSQITHDIARGLNTSFMNAERLKTLHGSAILVNDERNMIEVSPDGEHEGEMTMVSRALLSEIINARLEEMNEIILKKLVASKMSRFAGNRIVLTGGGSQLIGIKELVSDMFGKSVRLARPRYVNGLAEITSSPAFSTPVGMLLHIAETETALNSLTTTTSKSPLTGLMNWLKQSLS
jgi:cell division protein FtsA